MKNAQLIVLIFALSLFACEKENYQQSSTDQQAALGMHHNDKIIASAKYTGVEDPEKAVAGQYVVQLSPAYLKPGAEMESKSDGNRVDNGKAAEARATEGKTKIDALLKELGIGLDNVLYYYTEALAGFGARLSDDEVRRLLEDTRIISIEQDHLFQFDETPEEITDTPKSQVVPCGITRHGWGNGSNSSKWIWIVDSGIQLNHPDLNVVTNTLYARSFTGGTPNDCQGHGTHVAGTAAAKNNTIGVRGVSAGAPVVPVKVFNGCTNSGSLTSILAGINHVAMYDEAGDVCNLSLGGYYGNGCSTYSSYRTAVFNLANGGTWAVIAAGNDGAFAGNYQPACINGTRIVTVANMTCSGTFYYTSNWGVPPVDWIATGTQVYSTYLNSGYSTMTGTSMAAPHVSGIIHQRQGSPVQCGTVSYYGSSYKVACR